MAISKSIFFMHTSGRIGDIVIRQINGKTILSKKPGPSNKPPTKTQREWRKKFGEMMIAKKMAKQKK